jgi:replicative DNA helicase
MDTQATISQDLLLQPFDAARVVKLVEHFRLHPGDWDGLRTGYHYLDRLLRGLKKKRLITVAARPSIGKTTFGLNIGLNVAMQGGRVAIFSQEMDHNQILMRLAGMISGVPVDAIESGKFSLGGREWDVDPEYYDLFLSGIEAISTLKLRIHEGPISSTDLARAVHPFRNNIDLIIDDHIGWHTDEGQSEFVVATKAIKNLKRMADKMCLPVIAISQLNRATEQREDKRPVLSDLRSSGEVEQSSDVVIMLYREGYYTTPQEGSELVVDKLEAIIRKNRDGKVGTCYLAMGMGNGRITEKAEEQDVTWAATSLDEAVEEAGL